MRLKPTTKIRPRIEVATFAAILMALLFLFIVHNGGQIDLPIYGTDRPKAVHSTALPGADRGDALLVFIQRDGKIFFREQAIALDHLTPALRMALVNGAEKRVYINADRHARHSTVMEVLDAVRAAGIEKVSFLTEKGGAPASEH